MRDWLFVKPSKRLLLEALLAEPQRRWTRTQLAAASGQHAKARMDLHVGPLLDAGLLRRQGNIYTVVPDLPVAATLRQLLGELGAPLEVGERTP